MWCWTARERQLPVVGGEREEIGTLGNREVEGRQGKSERRSWVPGCISNSPTGVMVHGHVLLPPCHTRGAPARAAAQLQKVRHGHCQAQSLPQQVANSCSLPSPVCPQLQLHVLKALLSTELHGNLAKIIS